MSTTHFIVRIYGILIKNNKLLAVSESHKHKLLLKFPGGGLEYGEGIVDCLKREWKEETGHEIEEMKHFYTNDFFQASAFHKKGQVISMYYIVRCKKLNFDAEPKEPKLTYNWLNLDSLDINLFTLPIDKKVAELLKTIYKSDSMKT